MEPVQLPRPKQYFYRNIDLEWIHPNAPSVKYTSSIAKKLRGNHPCPRFYRAARFPACRAPQAAHPPHTFPAVITSSRTRASGSIRPAMK